MSAAEQSPETTPPVDCDHLVVEEHVVAGRIMWSCCVACGETGV